MAFKKKTQKAPESFHFEERGGPTVFADGMRHLTQEILNSFDARVAGVAASRHETVTMLRGFRQEMKNVHHELRRKAAELRRFLGNTESSRMRDFRALHHGIRAGQDARSRHLGGLLAGFRQMLFGFHQDHQAAASHWQSMAAALAKKRASFAR